MPAPYRMNIEAISLLPLVAIFALSGCSNTPALNVPSYVMEDGTTAIQCPMTAPTPALIEAAIENMVFLESTRNDELVLNSDLTDLASEADRIEYKGRYERCESAFRQLSSYGPIAFPYLLKHLDDRRASIPFRNHYAGHLVGDACQWNLYFQLVDHPDGYSEYGYQRKGKDGEFHPKPAWTGTPFDAEGGVKNWLKKREGRRYEELQIECQQWFLDAETKIGACDADSYFQNILPLEVSIAEKRELLSGRPDPHLARLKEIRDKRLVDAIPPELLPSKK